MALICLAHQLKLRIEAWGRRELLTVEMGLLKVRDHRPSISAPGSRLRVDCAGSSRCLFGPQQRLELGKHTQAVEDGQAMPDNFEMPRVLLQPRKPDGASRLHICLISSITLSLRKEACVRHTPTPIVQTAWVIAGQMEPSRSRLVGSRVGGFICSLLIGNAPYAAVPYR